MKNLIRIDTPPAYFDWHKDIVSSKNEPRKTRLKSLNTDVEIRFNEYDLAVNTNTLSNFTENKNLQVHSHDLQNCYSSKTSKLSEMLQKICDKQIPCMLKWCPYCGLTSPGSYDHYLPKELFPEFSVNPHNLVSACTKCNSAKGSRWISSKGRLFIHFYSDPLPDELFLFAKINCKSGAFSATYELRKPTLLHHNVWCLIENHFRELNLLEKYKSNTHYEIASTFNQCSAFLENGGTSISLHLESLAKREAKTFGDNHWRIVLLRALANNLDFASAAAAAI